MRKLIIVVEHAKDWASYFPSEDLVTAEQYLSGSATDSASAEVINLCRNFRYLGLGYYCSLLAEARGHRIIPDVRTINDLSRKSIYSLDFEDLDQSLQKALGGQESGEQNKHYELLIYFGQTQVEAMRTLARQIYDLFPCPILKVSFRRQKHWQIAAIKTVGINNLTDAEEDEFADALDHFSKKIWRSPRLKKKYRYDLAILHNPDEALSPSNKAALQNFIKAGDKLGIDVDMIQADNFNHVAEYDALFIRETTALNHHTYRFAKRAASENMVVIDDPISIQRCTNKVFLFEKMIAARVPVPRTRVLFRDKPQELEQLKEQLGFPVVLKVPDGSFSRGIIKVETPEELQPSVETLFKQSVLILAQEYFYTEFDWRIGILNRRPLFACQYFMAKGHWQIYNHNSTKGDKSGGFACLPVQQAPELVLKAALKAANLIGEGLYGVDLKQRGDQVVVIEVNDNPNIDAGVEDAYLGKQLYRDIMQEFLRRMEIKRSG